MSGKQMKENKVNKLSQDQHDDFLAQLITALLSYWNALLTGNGLLLATLSIVLTIKVETLLEWQLRLIVATLSLNLLALVLILWCFRSQRDHYLDMLSIQQDPPATDEETKQILSSLEKIVIARHKLRKWFESFSAAVTIISVVVIILVIAK